LALEHILFDLFERYLIVVSKIKLKTNKLVVIAMAFSSKKYFLLN